MLKKKVADVLKKLKIKWSFEQPVFIWDENKRPRVWTPDFYLIDFGIYLEVCGSEKFDYGYRKNIFNRNGYQVIFLHLFKKSNLWMKHLLNYLNLFILKRLEKMNSVNEKR